MNNYAVPYLCATLDGAINPFVMIVYSHSKEGAAEFAEKEIRKWSKKLSEQLNAFILDINQIPIYHYFEDVGDANEYFLINDEQIIELL